MLRLSARTSSPSDSGGGVGSRRHARSRLLVSCSTIAADRVRLVEREGFAAAIDRDLQRACRAEAAARLALGSIAHELVRRRGYRRLGFVRLADYARERLGISARALESAAGVAARLADLPRIATAFHAGELSWTKVRLLAGIADGSDEHVWLNRARSGSVEVLETLIREHRDARGEAPLADPVADPESELVDGEPSVVLRIACPSRLRVLWRHACELASRMAGEPHAPWQAAEVIAAEGIASRPVGASVGDRVLLAFLGLARRLPRLAELATGYRSVASAIAVARCVQRARSESPADTRDVEQAAAMPSSSPLRLSAPSTSDPFELDTRIREAMGTLRGIEPEIGRLLRLVIDHRLYQSLGSRSLHNYVRERLGISLRKVWALVKIERNIRRTAPFAAAYEQGRLSWVRALALLPVIDRSTADDWIRRANASS